VDVFGGEWLVAFANLGELFLFSLGEFWWPATTEIGA